MWSFVAAIVVAVASKCIVNGCQRRRRLSHPRARKQTSAFWIGSIESMARPQRPAIRPPGDVDSFSGRCDAFCPVFFYCCAPHRIDLFSLLFQSHARVQRRACACASSGQVEWWRKQGFISNVHVARRTPHRRARTEIWHCAPRCTACDSDWTRVDPVRPSEPNPTHSASTTPAPAGLIRHLALCSRDRDVPLLILLLRVEVARRVYDGGDEGDVRASATTPCACARYKMDASGRP